MDKKTRKAIRRLAKVVVESQERNAREWGGRILEALERQAETNRATAEALRSLTEALEAPHDEGEEPAVEEIAPEHDGTASDEREVTEAARRRAEEIGVDLSEVEGTGSGGRVLVKDVERAAG